MIVIRIITLLLCFVACVSSVVLADDTDTAYSAIAWPHDGMSTHVTAATTMVGGFIHYHPAVTQTIYLRNIQFYAQDGKGTNYRAMIYRHSDSNLVTYTNTIQVSGAGEYTVPVIDTIALERGVNYWYVIYVGADVASEYTYKPSSGAGDTIFTRYYAGGMSGVPAKLASGLTKTSNRGLNIRVSFGDEPPPEGITHNLSFISVGPDSFCVRDSIQFRGGFAYDFDSLRFEADTVTSVPLRSDTFNYATRTVIDTLMLPEERYRVDTFPVFVDSGEITAVRVAAYFIDTTLHDTIVDTSESSLYRMAVQTSNTVKVQAGLPQSAGGNSTMLRIAPEYSYGEQEEMRVNGCAGTYAERAVLSFTDLWTILPTANTKYIHRAILHIVTAADTGRYWADSVRINAALSYEPFTVLSPGTTTGYPSWVHRTVTSHWSDSGCGTGSRRIETTPYVYVDATPYAEYEIDVTPLIAFLRNVNLVPYFVLFGDDTGDCNYTHRREFFSSNYTLDPHKRPWLEITCSNAEGYKPLQYMTGAAGGGVRCDSGGVSVMTGGFSE